jgi:hypothetical protein
MGKMRSPNYPAVGLSEAIQRVRSLWAKEKRTAVPMEVAATAIGYGGVSGPSRTAVAALKKYGLVDTDARNVSVSALALRILHPSGPEDALTATREAALKPELFGQLYESHRNASDDALRSFLINRLGFSEVGAKQLIKAFRDTISLAKLDQTDYSTVAGFSAEATVERAHQDTTVSGWSDGVNVKVSPVQSWSWPLSIPRNVKAELKITGELTGGDIRRLKKQIDALGEAFDDASDQLNLSDSDDNTVG